MSFEQILVPYDASSYANHAFDEALKIAEKFGSKITVLTILGSNVEHHSGISLQRAIEIQDEHEDAATKILKDLEGTAKGRGVEFSFKVIYESSPIQRNHKFRKFKLYRLNCNGVSWTKWYQKSSFRKCRLRGSGTRKLSSFNY